LRLDLDQKPQSSLHGRTLGLYAGLPHGLGHQPIVDYYVGAHFRTSNVYNTAIPVYRSMKNGGKTEKPGTLTCFAFTDRSGLRNVNGKMGERPQFPVSGS
jgi:hypothetical protein